MAKAASKIVQEKASAKKPAANASPTGRQIYKVALGEIIGSVIERNTTSWSPALIAATVLGRRCSSSSRQSPLFRRPSASTGIGVIIRPVGAYIFGNMADRIGRKEALVYALVLMGVSTLLIGADAVLRQPSASPAPILLIAFRLSQRHQFAPNSARLDLGGRTGGAFQTPPPSGAPGSALRFRSGC